MEKWKNGMLEKEKVGITLTVKAKQLLDQGHNHLTKRAS